MNPRNQTGFTLYELLTTMTIIGVVLAIGVPNMASFRQSSRMTSTANDLHSVSSASAGVTVTTASASGTLRQASFRMIVMIPNSFYLTTCTSTIESDAKW